MKNLPKVLTLREIADRISTHLTKMERDLKYNVVDLKHKTRRLYYAGAGTYGAKVGVTYVSYQGHSLLTRAEALSYLAALDAGYRGEHFQWLEKHPAEKKQAETRYRALVRTRFGYALFDVTNLTETRVYGKEIPRDEYRAALGDDIHVTYVGYWIARSELLTLRGTMKMLRQVLNLEKRRDKEHQKVDQQHNEELNHIIGVAT